MPTPSRLELSLSDTQKLALGKDAAHAAVAALVRSLATEARSNPANTHLASGLNHSHHAGPSTRGIAARGHRRSESGTLGASGRCAAPAACWRDVCELVDLATQHYLFDRERGASDPLYVAEELAMMKGGAGAEGGMSSPNSASNGHGHAYETLNTSAYGLGGLDEDFTDVGTCRCCARASEGWARKERERLWRSIPSWFRTDI